MSTVISFRCNPSAIHALGRSIRELNGVGYHSEILATPATALSSFCELPDDGYRFNSATRLRSRMALGETQAPVAQPVLAPVLRAEVKRLSTCNRVVAGSNPALRPRGLGSSAVEHFFRFASPRSHPLRAEGTGLSMQEWVAGSSPARGCDPGSSVARAIPRLPARLRART